LFAPQVGILELDSDMSVLNRVSRFIFFKESGLLYLYFHGCH
jgi:hypothetical protein